MTGFGGVVLVCGLPRHHIGNHRDATGAEWSYGHAAGGWFT
jgi:hypothetical protein